MELSTPLQEHLQRSACLHTRLCPRQVLGVRMARFACTRLGLDPAIQRKRLFVYMENSHCLADGVIAVTQASPTNHRMQLVSYGKMAATFVNLLSGQAIRVAEHPGCRQAALACGPAGLPPWETQLRAYQVLPDEQLLSWQNVEILVPPAGPSKKRKVVCERCGDFVHEYCEVRIGGSVLCKVCAYGGYYRPIADPQSL